MAGQGDRRAEDEGPQLQHDRRGHAHDRRLRPLDGHQVGVTACHGNDLKAREGIDREKLAARRRREDGQGTRKAKFDETIEIAMNPAPRAAPRPTRPGPRVPTSSAPKTRSRRSRAARSISTAASRPRPDAAGRTPRQGAGPARPDAQPEGRHRHDGRDDCGQGRQGGSVEFRVGGPESSMQAQQGLVCGRQARREHPRSRMRQKASPRA